MIDFGCGAQRRAAREERAFEEQRRLWRHDRRRAVAQLKQEGYNYFTGFRDTHATNPAGLSFGKAEWCALIPYEKDI